MSQGEPIRLFVTHAWEEGDDYLRVFEYLESARNFRYRNLSTPTLHPAKADNESLREALRQQIANAEVIIALASLSAQHLTLLSFELHFAKSGDKPVVMLPGFGREFVLPKDFKGLIDETVNWDERALTDAVRRQARHEDTTRWDTIEFKLD